MDRPLKIGCDVDDILNNSLYHWVSEYNRKFGKNYICSDIVEWDLTKFIPENEFGNFLSILESKDFFDTLEPDRMAQAILQELTESGKAEIYLITGTYPQSVLFKTQWLQKFFPFIPENNILFVKQGNKHLVNVDIMIEDCPEDITKFHCPVILYNKSYNINYNFNSNANIHRVNDWLSIRNIFAEKYDIIDIDNPHFTYLLQMYGVPIDTPQYSTTIEDEEVDIDNTVSDNLIKQIVLAYGNEEKIANLIRPYVKNSYDFGYSCALKDMANAIGELTKQ